MRLKGGRKEFVAQHGLSRRDAAELSIEFSSAFGQKRRPHLQEAIGKARLENPSGDGRKWHLKTQVGALPDLLLAALERPQRLWLLCAELHAALGSKDLDEPRVRLAGSQTLHLKTDRDIIPLYLNVGVQQGIIPCVAGAIAPFPSGRS